MYHINFNNPIHVHFIGIGGISMSGLAHILRIRILPYPAQMLLNLHSRKNLLPQAVILYTTRRLTILPVTLT